MHSAMNRHTIFIATALLGMAQAGDGDCPSRTGWVIAGAIVFVLGLTLAFFVGYYVGTATAADASATRYYASNARPLLQTEPSQPRMMATESSPVYTSGEDDDDFDDYYVGQS